MLRTTDVECLCPGQRLICLIGNPPCQMAILVQAIFVQTVRCACAFAEGDFVVSILRPRQTDSHLLQGVECDGDPSDGWVKVLRGRCPPSEQWPLAKKSPTKTDP